MVNAMKNNIFRVASAILKRDILKSAGMLMQKCINNPYMITVFLTQTCNARCIMCDHWKKSDSSRELSSKEWLRFISSLHDWLKTANITFIGGEPLLKEGFFEILEHTSKLGFYTTVATNGMMLTPENCDRLIGAGIDYVIFSVNSIDPATNDRYKGVEGVHRTIISAVDYIKKKKNKVKICFMLIVTNDNYRTLGDFASWAKHVGADIVNFQTIRDNLGPDVSIDRLTRASPDNPLWKIDDLEELDRQIDLLISQKKCGLPIVTPYEELEKMKVYYRDATKAISSHLCPIGFTNLFVMSTGDIRMCYYFPPIGNIREGSIRDAWFSEKAQSQRKEIMHCNKTCVASGCRNYSFLEKILYFSKMLKSGNHV